jgi:hypothetical protein
MEAGESSEIPHESHVVLVPMRLQENRIVDGINFVPSSWGAPLVAALRGKDGNEEPWIGIADETPINWLRLGSPISRPGWKFSIFNDLRLITG